MPLRSSYPSNSPLTPWGAAKWPHFSRKMSKVRLLILWANCWGFDLHLQEEGSEGKSKNSKVTQGEQETVSEEEEKEEEEFVFTLQEAGTGEAPRYITRALIWRVIALDCKTRCNFFSCFFFLFVGHSLTLQRSLLILVQLRGLTGVGQR